MTWRSRRRRSTTKLAMALATLAAAPLFFLAASARADWLDDISGSSTEPFCPLIYGPMCDMSLSVDLALLYQRSVLLNRADEGIFRYGGDVSFLKRTGSRDGEKASPLHLGGGLEIGGQAGSMGSGFHLTPRARIRYFPRLGPVTLELGSGFVYERIWLNNEEGAHNYVGISQELSVGVLGFGSVVGGADLVREVSGPAGTEARFMIGARLSIVTVLYILALSGR